MQIEIFAMLLVSILDLVLSVYFFELNSLVMILVCTALLQVIVCHGHYKLLFLCYGFRVWTD